MTISNELGYATATSAVLTYEVDATSATAIGTNYKEQIGKAFTITGNGTVGFGASGDKVFGIVQMIEKFKSNSDTLIAALQVSGMAEDVPVVSTTAQKPSAGNNISVDGSGNICVAATNAPTNTLSRAFAFSVDTTNNKAVIML